MCLSRIQSQILGQAMLIIRFPFQAFEKMMQAVIIHYSLLS